MMTRVALVTGADKGIGYEIAGGLGRAGYSVLAAARDRTRGGAAAADLAADGSDVRFVRLDVADERSIAEAAAWVSREFGRLDVLVNNAGITDSLTVVPSETTLAGMRSVYEVNVFGVVAVTNAMLGLLKRSVAGRIVNMSSGLGSLAAQTSSSRDLPLLLSYSSSKSAMNAITVQYARELASTAIKVNSCAPGKCATDLNGHSSERSAAQGAKVAVGLATVDDSGPTGGFFDENGSMAW